MNYMEWILFGIMQGFCSAAACIVHGDAELLEAAYETAERQPELPEWYGEDDYCIPGVVLFPSDGDPA